LRVCIAAWVLLLGAGRSLAQEPAPALGTTHGIIEKIDKESLTILPRGPDGKVEKGLTLKLTGTSQLSAVTEQKRAGKVVLVQRLVELQDLEPRQAITVIHGLGPSGPVLLAAVVHHAAERHATDDSLPALPRGVPAKVATVLKHIDETKLAPKGYEGGRTFLNLGRDGEESLPRRDAQGRAISYHEWDVNPHVPGVNRGPERLVTGSDGSAYYTGDHYRTFTKIR
jgi:guanyl-specific ribonuclease Sa